MTRGEIKLPEHVVFEELPFCGVLLDKRRFEVYRLSQRATAVLRKALHGTSAVSPYESLISVEETTEELEYKVVDALVTRGLVCRGSAGENRV